MTEFSPIYGLLGGVMIGLAASGLLLANGKIAGISGILARSFEASRDDRAWRVAFLVGLPLGAWAVQALVPSSRAFSLSSDVGVLVLGGLLVGFGTQLGNGCTSGHGVCGLARGSRRSIVATGVFLSVAIATVLVVRHAPWGL